MLAGCSSVEFTQPVYFYRDKPGPVAAAVRNNQRKALNDEQAIRVTREAMKLHHHRLATNLPPLPPDEGRRR